MWPEWLDRSDGAQWRGNVSRAVIVDSLALEHVVGNLLDNALHCGLQPVNVTPQQENAGTIIEISDHGPGIPPAQREFVFEPFTRLESSRNSNTGGTGLGLAIVREICRSHGWHVSLNDNPARGTTVRLVLANSDQ